MAGPIAGILLTGGRSRRLGVDKAQVDLDGEVLAVRAARLLSGVCDPCIEVGAGTSGLRCVRETPTGDGPLAALLAGVAALGLRAGESVLLFGCDYPNMTGALLRCIADRDGSTVVPVVDGQAQYVCAKYGGLALGAAVAAYASGARGFRWLHDDAHARSVDWIDEATWGAVGTASAFRDLDTPADATALGIDLDARTEPP